ncbi:MAG: hypothetical protein JRI95_10945 [Deltaproteobacteria bacterium]|nr:hypothetical protein [Deltaproteobacteria bacterium]MBW2084586.1 hypothetical protein [Deltaproteobacteria bacterium]
MDDAQFRQLLDQLGLSWEGFRKVRKGVKKRLRRHIQERGYQSSEAYFEALGSNHHLREECERLMTVSISRFFRDRYLWRILENEILPAVIERKGTVKIWSAGCACGEEVYSFKILLNLLKDRYGHIPDHEILATDLNPAYLDRARTGIYPKSSLKEAPEEWLALYFEHQARGNLYRVASFLKNNVTWKAHNLLSDPPQTIFDVIFLRNNLLTYYQDTLKIPALQAVIGRLAPGGFLIIGSHEIIPLTVSSLLPFRGQRYIFERLDDDLDESPQAAKAGI